MSEQLWCLMQRYGTKMQVERGHYLYRQWEEPSQQCVYLLDKGICSLSNITRDGEERVYLYFNAKRMIGFNQLIKTSNQAMKDGPSLSIISKTHCVLYKICSQDFYRLVATNSQFNAALIRTLSENYQEVLVHFHHLQEESAAARLCRLLLDTARLKNGALTVPAFFTYEELAKYLGTHPVTVSRIMAKLKKEGYLSKSGKEIIVDEPENLDRLIHSKTSLDY